MAKWAFVTNHGAVLSIIAQDGQIPAREIAANLGITERTVNRIMRDLNVEGYIEKTSEDNVNQYRVHHHLPLRYRGSRDIDVGHLLRMMEHWR